MLVRFLGKSNQLYGDTNGAQLHRQRCSRSIPGQHVCESRIDSIVWQKSKDGHSNALRKLIAILNSIGVALEPKIVNASFAYPT
jgi:hypothetical protein